MTEGERFMLRFACGWIVSYTLIEVIKAVAS